MSLNGRRVGDSPTRTPKADGADFAYPLFSEVRAAHKGNYGNPAAHFPKCAGRISENYL